MASSGIHASGDMVSIGPLRIAASILWHPMRPAIECPAGTTVLNVGVIEITDGFSVNISFSTTVRSS